MVLHSPPQIIRLKAQINELNSQIANLMTIIDKLHRRKTIDAVEEAQANIDLIFGKTKALKRTFKSYKRQVLKEIIVKVSDVDQS